MAVGIGRSCCRLSAASICAIALLPLGATGLAPGQVSVRDNDVTEKVENLGNPFSQSPGLFLASSLEQGRPRVRRILFPDGDQPLDWVTYDNHVYVLTRANAADGAEVRVYRFQQEDPSERQEVLHFRAPTFARSFEILNGDFYFGLGCQVNDSPQWDRQPLPPATGDILRVKAEFVRERSGPCLENRSCQ